jgi:hypothetical protein
MLNQSELQSLLHYNQDNGIFTWINPVRKTMVNAIAGTMSHEGYIVIKINKKIYRAHRLAWLYVYGEFPLSILDHVNGIKNDNRISNLRNSTFQQNIFNRKNESINTSGHKGVHWETAREAWKAVIVIDNQHIYLGRYKHKQEAINAYLASAKKHHGEFYRGEIRA